MLRALLYRRPVEPEAISLAFEGEIYLIRLRRHRQARRYTLRVQAATREVVLTLPPRGSLKEAKAFAEKHGAWIAARLDRLPVAAPFVHGTVLPLRGVPHRIVHRPGKRGTVWAESDGPGRPLLCVAGDPPHVLDYLAAHEVAHLVEMNHSPRFWRLVKRLYPDVERAKAWLEANGTDLHRYGATEID